MTFYFFLGSSLNSNLLLQQGRVCSRNAVEEAPPVVAAAVKSKAGSSQRNLKLLNRIMTQDKAMRRKVSYYVCFFRTRKSVDQK